MMKSLSTFAAAAALGTALGFAAAAVSPAHAQEGDRRDRRSGELALPDEYLDPAWPDELGASPVVPEDSDSVERVPAPDEAADQAEVEEMQRYKEALGLNAAKDDFAQDHWEEDKAAEPGTESDPAEW